MPENKVGKIQRETFVEKLVRRVLETVGGGVDSVFGRGKKQDAPPSTSDLGNRLRKMLDEAAQINKDGRKLAPHLIGLKYAWRQSSDKLQIELKRLKNELLVTAIDHINDNRYATLGQVKIVAKADILTAGFRLAVGFDETSLAQAEGVEIPLEIYAKLLPQNDLPAPSAPLQIEVETKIGLPAQVVKTRILCFKPDGKSNLVVGRTKENDLFLDDASVSRYHASLVMAADGKILVADTGSSNGTFVNGTRIAYGKAVEIAPNVSVKFGDVETFFAWELPAPEPEPTVEDYVSSVETATEIHEPDAQKISDEPETVPGREVDELKTYLNEPVEDAMKTHLNTEAEDDPAKTYLNSDAPDEAENAELLSDFRSSLKTNPLDTSDKS